MHRGAAAGIGALAVLAVLAVVAGPRTIPALLLLVLPGGWLVFGARSSSLPLSGRLAVAVVFTPPVLAIQFALLHLAGFAFGPTCWLLALVNLPVVAMLWRSPREHGARSRATRLMYALGLVALVVGLLPQLLSPQGAAYSGHAWWHADVMYQVANGGLVLEEPELAGVRMGYAWIGHIYQAVPAYLADASPLAMFIWHNVAWLLATVLLVGLVVIEVGGRSLARLASVAWLALGVNGAGYALYLVLRRGPVRDWLGGPGAGLGRILAFGGDWRITPWVLKYYFLHQMLIGIGAFAALLYLLVRQCRPDGAPRGGHALVFVLVASVGLIYPVLLPAAVAAVAAAVVLEWWLPDAGAGRPAWRRAMPLVAALGAAVLISCLALAFVTRDRVTPAVAIASPRAMRDHAIIAAAAFLPFLLALPFVLRAGWDRHRRQLLLLGMTGGASLVLYVAAAIPGGGLEYKFIFTAAVAMTPFAAIGTEMLLERLTARAWLRWSAVGMLVALLALPLVHKLRTDGWSRLYIPALDRERLASYPALDLRGFATRLQPGEPYAALVDAVRRDTPVATVLVTRDTAIHFPTLTQRSMYVAPEQVRSSYPGINVPMDQVLTDMRGYDPLLIAERRATVSRLFEAADDAGRTRALAAMAIPGRPLAVIAELPRDTALVGWLAMRPGTRVIARDAAHAAWLVEPRPPSP